MIVTNHVAFALAASIGAMAADIVPTSPLAIAAAAAGGVLPDIDEPRSWIGRRVPVLAHPINALFGHRGFTHSLTALALLGLGLSTLVAPLGSLAAPAWSLVCLPFLIGYASHLLGDLLTPSGVPLSWPMRRRQAFALFPSANPESLTGLLVGRHRVMRFGSLREALVAWGALALASLAWLSSMLPPGLR